MRNESIVGGLGIVAVLAFTTACSPSSTDGGGTCATDCGGAASSSDATHPIEGSSSGGAAGADPGGGPSAPPGSSDDGIQNGTETDVDCGGASAPRCAEGKKCLVDADCHAACNYAKRCVDVPSCKPRLGGDTCGVGEVGQTGAQHESCCRTLAVPGYADPAHPGKTVYLDKYEITTGRVRAFLADIAGRNGGTPNVRAWIVAHTPAVWDPSWNQFLPADVDGETILVDRKLLGDPRGTWPGAPPVPPTDEPRKTGTDFQFNGSLFMYLHGNNCSTHAPDSYGFPTWFYPAAVLTKMGPEFPARADGVDLDGNTVPASEHLEVKAMNCITNALLQAFCHWDGGQLATDDVLDFVTGSPPELGNAPGCGTQIGTEDPPVTDAAIRGGRCADLSKINATYDAGGSLPSPSFPLNTNNYEFPYFPGGASHDKAWEVAAPGRGTSAAAGQALDQVRINPGDEPWMDLAGNLSEAVLTMDGATFTGRFGLKYRGIGFQSARSRLNFDPKWDPSADLARIERAQAKAAFTGGRCMRFR